MSAVLLDGMQGMGDNLHQRAIVRALAKENSVWLKTPFPQLYHDMPELHLIPRHSRLRTQAKNEARSSYEHTSPPTAARFVTCSYSPQQVKSEGSVLGAMSLVCGVPVGDFRMVVPHGWRGAADKLFPEGRPKRPILVYRPLVARTEWSGSSTRNPDAEAYAQIFASIRERFFVVSVADLVPKVEWIVSTPIKADLEFHKGELFVEVLAGLFKRAALVYSAPGFATVLAQAVNTPAVCVFGGYEDARSFSAGARHTPWLGIEPIQPCACWRHDHQCDKRINVPAAIETLGAFVKSYV